MASFTQILRLSNFFLQHAPKSSLLCHLTSCFQFMSESCHLHLPCEIRVQARLSKATIPKSPSVNIKSRPRLHHQRWLASGMLTNLSVSRKPAVTSHASPQQIRFTMLIRSWEYSQRLSEAGLGIVSLLPLRGESAEKRADRAGFVRHRFQRLRRIPDDGLQVDGSIG
ncbi:uncharacterized protein LY89DRAFT_383983 [Mollisia scopiformis]|uniref:Uncharacterized protein n=1 Tax=Mollisia scopiformis TaxID=149040 RepID=A0A194XNN3_MOLSC|nr:uncharacterized protein LY89DRAFT_383983 [Mollisia scopiformis]KUJ21778.1 hypothetical protein LY89DRAFT_383983 [Mollisia scopiformis]